MCVSVSLCACVFALVFVYVSASTCLRLFVLMHMCTFVSGMLFLVLTHVCVLVRVVVYAIHDISNKIRDASNAAYSIELTIVHRFYFMKLVEHSKIRRFHSSLSFQQV